MQFASAIPATAAARPTREKPPKQKHDPEHVAAARELRDRYLERVNNDQTALPAPVGKYDVTRQQVIDATANLAPRMIAA